MEQRLPYLVRPTGIAWVGDRVENVAPSWAMFNREDLKGRMTLLNDSRETIGAALKFLGHSLNTTDEAQITAANEVVIGWKRNIAKFESDQYDGGLASS